MKYLLLLSLLLHQWASAQTQKPTPMTMSASPDRIKQTFDTVRTSDPDEAGREYLVITDAKKMVKQQGPMLNGQKDGTWREYGGTNSNMQRIDEFKKGRLNGVSCTFNASGMPLTDETYRNDTLNGRRMVYTISGRVRLIENYTNGALDGERFSFYDDGKLQEEGFYVKGKRQGVTKWYSQNGNLSLQYTYTNGELNGLAKQYDDKGLIKQEGDFLNNSEEGEWKEYEGGVLVKKIVYKGGNVVKETVVRK